MKFVDEVTIKVKAGDGGRGCVSFRREKFVPRGGPNGGDGGDGGDVVVVVEAQLSTLLDLRYQREYRSGRGAHGRGKDQHGRNGEERVIRVPVGTIITDTWTSGVLADLKNDADRVIVAKGGKGGKGNAAFASSRNRAPRRAQPGLPGEERELRVELRLLADVGIIGLPNVGKSTLIAALSAARPKIADYPFTTLVPNLGVVSYEEGMSFVLADIPGLIEGAHLGEGLGDRFLKHVSRTVLLIHVIDALNIKEEDPLADYVTVNRELEQFDRELAQKPQIVVVNKIDLPEGRERLGLLEGPVLHRRPSLFAVSGVTGEGLKELKGQIASRLEAIRAGVGGERVAAGA